MKKAFFSLCAALLAGTSLGAQSSTMSLSDAVSRAAKTLETRLAPGTKIAILNFPSLVESFSNYIIDELIEVLVMDGKLTVIERKNLDLIRDEMNIQLSGNVSDDSVQSIGKQLGAQTVVSGSLTELGDMYRFRVKAINVETARIEAQVSYNLGNDQQITFLLYGNQPKPIAPSRPASLPSPGPYSPGAAASLPANPPAPRPAPAPQTPLPPGPVVARGFAAIPGGTFSMGSPASEPGRKSDEVQHQVTVNSFFMGKYEVTQKEYQEIMGENPSYFKGDNLPVECVRWYDAVEYCNRRSAREGLTPAYAITGTAVTWNRKADGYRLPTEAEWEYACRAGTITPYSTGSSVDNAGWYDENSGKTTHPVGQKRANSWGLFDMHGNVWEWCWDWYEPYNAASEADPAGPESGSARVLRGGSWGYPVYDLRSANRDVSSILTYRHSGFGFRLVRSGPPPAAPAPVVTPQPAPVAPAPVVAPQPAPIAPAPVSPAPQPAPIAPAPTPHTQPAAPAAPPASATSAYNRAGLYADGVFQDNYDLLDSLDWIKLNAKDGGKYAVVLGSDYAANNVQLDYSKKKITVSLAAFGGERKVTFDRNLNDPLFTVNEGVTFTLEEGVTLSGKDKKSSNLVKVNYGTFVMNGGALKDTASSAVSVYNGSFTMNGGSISGCSGYLKQGSGVYVNSGTFTMSGGTISGNSSIDGGGVYVNSGTFTMSGGTISGNSGYRGGGVGVDGTFTMSGGTISKNTGNEGGGVYMGSGTFTMIGGIISENKTSDDGGGVYVKGTFTMNGGTISENSATEYRYGHSNGGGVYVVEKFIMNNGTISENTAKNVGGGVFARGSFTMTGGTISGNIGNGVGGNVYGNGGGGGVYGNKDITISGGIISGNTVTGNGGGVYVNEKLTMTGGAIGGNTASGLGGGVYILKDKVFTKSGTAGIIYGSNAPAGQVNKASSDEAGHAVLVDGDRRKVRNTTADADTALDSAKSRIEGGGWE